jgi:alkanesulfonate monooxygenase SsuD/methylene tetrahydromethanopterin reductase-like flavin-dependent oxidoreductase (luciferase family)
MQLGSFFLFNRPADRSENEMLNEDLDLMQATEALGFSSIWAAEHHFGDYGICPSPALALAAIARTTKTIRLGTAVVVLPLHNPIRVAEELAFVDQISGGRLDVGVGRGYRDKELRAYHVRHEDTRPIFGEWLEIILRGWKEPLLSYEGQFFQASNVEVRPRPFQSPHPRLFVGSLSQETFGIVGNLGTNLLFTPRFDKPKEIDSLIEYRDQIQRYKDLIREHGGDPSQREVGALRFIYCAESDEQARRDFEGPMRWFRAEAARQNMPVEAIPATAGDDWKKYQRGPDFNFDEASESGQLICGSPATVVRRLEEMQQYWDLDTLICWTRVGDLPASKVLRSTELMAKEVLPHFAGKAVASATA